MSIKVQGSSAQIEALKEQLKQEGNTTLPEFGEDGELGELGKVPADTAGLLQRETKLSTLKKMGSFDPLKFTPISVARFPDKSENTYDGDHRRHLWGMTFGYNTDIPAYIKEVKDTAEYHRLFASANGKDRKNLNANEIFFHEFHGDLPEALLDGKRLVQCSLSLCGSPDDPVKGFIGKHTDPQVSIGGFRKSLEYGITNVIHAVATLKAAWPDDSYIQTELLSALSLLYKTYPVLMSRRKGAKIPKEFQAWFARHLCISSQKPKAREWKNKGGNVHHKATESVALGILKEFLSVSLDGGSANKGKVLKQNKLTYLMETTQK